ncbi:MAG TPA: hypothetical protein ENJ45_02340 [Phaeodactylibacter sp.]|nr:hypothetical protein [Phaeodactylibacter sp.]
MDLKELESGVDPKTHWYYQSKKIPLFRYFRKVAKETGRKITVIDFGSGSGFFAYELWEAFPQHIEEVLLIDIGYTEDEIEETKNLPVKKLHYIPEGIDHCIVIMMDVLEHIEDDYAIIEDIKRRVGSESWYFITVPAFQSLWSTHDVYLGHYRRYTIPMLSKLLRHHKCHIAKQYYIFAAIFLPAWFIRRLKRNQKNMEAPQSSDMAPLPAPLNFALRAYNSFEMNFRKLNRLFGLTCVAEGKF